MRNAELKIRLNHPAPRTISFALCAFLFLVLCAVSLTGCGKSAPVIQIGFAAPLSGDQAPEGQDMLRGAQLAVERANAQGRILPGYRLELVPLDDQHSPTQAVAVAKKLVANANVVAVVGHLNSSCSMPASAVYHQARLVQISPVSSNPQISRQGFDTFYRTCATDDLQGPAAATFIAEQLHAKRVFVLDDMTTYGRGLANELIAQLKVLHLEISGHEGITQEDKDFVPILTKIKSMNPDLVYFAGMFPQGALLIKQRAEVGLASTFMGGDGLFDPRLISLGTPQAAEGAYLTKLGANIYRIPTAKQFVQEYEARFGPIGAYSAYAYEAASIAIWAIRHAGVRDRQTILAAMKTVKDYPGLFGKQNFDEKGDSLIRDIGVVTVKGGRFVEIGTYTLKDGRFIFEKSAIVN